MFDPMDHEVPAHDLLALGELADQTTFNRVAVEVGAWAGHSTLVLERRCWRVYAVDHWKGNPADRLGQVAADLGADVPFLTFCSNMGDRLFRSVYPLRGESVLWAAAWNQPIDILFIDADHRYEAVRLDIASWVPHVRPGGYVIFHDFGVFPGVTQAVDEAFPHRKRAGASLAFHQVRERGVS